MLTIEDHLNILKFLHLLIKESSILLLYNYLIILLINLTMINLKFIQNC
jgi:hypothetical protein